jgi:hypothetical protein
MTETYTIKYPPRSIVYSLEKSLIGVLEKVVIKTFQVNIGEFTHGQPVILYTDTLNEWWLETDLCPKSQAVENAIAYFNSILEESEEEED